MPLESWKSFFEIGGVILLFLTFIFGAGVVFTTNKLNERQAEQLRVFDRNLTDAKTDLGEQQERAAKADSKVAALQNDAANAKAAQLRVEIDLAKQREKTAGAEKALLELQARLADRKLTQPQRNDLTNLLKEWPGTDVDVIVWGDSAEVEIITGQILECLQNAGWHLHAGHSGGGGAVRGILVGTRPDADNNTTKAANALVSALQSAGLASTHWKFEEMTTPSLLFNSSYTGKAPVRLFIGGKAPN